MKSAQPKSTTNAVAIPPTQSSNNNNKKVPKNLQCTLIKLTYIQTKPTQRHLFPYPYVHICIYVDVYVSVAGSSASVLMYRLCDLAACGRSPISEPTEVQAQTQVGIYYVRITFLEMRMHFKVRPFELFSRHSSPMLQRYPVKVVQI